MSAHVQREAAVPAGLDVVHAGFVRAGYFSRWGGNWKMKLVGIEEVNIRNETNRSTIDG